MTSWSELHCGIIAHVQTRRPHQRGDSGHGALSCPVAARCEYSIGGCPLRPVAWQDDGPEQTGRGRMILRCDLPFGKEFSMARTTSAKTSTADKKASGTAKNGGTPKAAATDRGDG